MDGPPPGMRWDFSLYLTIQGAEYHADGWIVEDEDDLREMKEGLRVHLEMALQAADSHGDWEFRVERVMARRPDHPAWTKD